MTASFQEKEIALVCGIILENRFVRVVLQFAEEYISKCYEVYNIFESFLGEDVEIFVIGDSTFGLSVDDVSAAHISSDILVYLGPEYDACSSLPVIVLPPRIPLDQEIFLQSLIPNLSEHLLEVNSCLLVCSPSFFHESNFITKSISQLVPDVRNVRLPPCANLEKWGSDITDHFRDEVLIGGVYLDKDSIAEISTIIYVGNDFPRINSFALRLTQHKIIALDPCGSEIISLCGKDLRIFRERYGGVARVEKAKIIGVIIGTMGLTGVETKYVIKRLQALIFAARKKLYTFVMGKVNEAKLCNFPEVMLFLYPKREWE